MRRRKVTSGKYIRRWRSNLGLSYEDVAEALEVDPITVRNWEKRASLKRYIRLAFDAAFRVERVKFIAEHPGHFIRLPKHLGGSQPSPKILGNL